MNYRLSKNIKMCFNFQKEKTLIRKYRTQRINKKYIKNGTIFKKKIKLN